MPQSITYTNNLITELQRCTRSAALMIYHPHLNNDTFRGTAKIVGAEESDALNNNELSTSFFQLPEVSAEIEKATGNIYDLSSSIDKYEASDLTWELVKSGNYPMGIMNGVLENVIRGGIVQERFDFLFIDNKGSGHLYKLVSKSFKDDQKANETVVERLGPLMALACTGDYGALIDEISIVGYRYDYVTPYPEKRGQIVIQEPQDYLYMFSFDPTDEDFVQYMTSFDELITGEMIGIQDMVEQRDYNWIPEAEIGSQCNKPYECPFIEYCKSILPDDATYFYLKKGRGSDFEKLRGIGVSTMQDLVRLTYLHSDGNDIPRTAGWFSIMKNQLNDVNWTPGMLDQAKALEASIVSQIDEYDLFDLKDKTMEVADAHAKVISEPALSPWEEREKTLNIHDTRYRDKLASYVGRKSFIDFETFSTTVGAVSGAMVNASFPCQWSCHNLYAEPDEYGEVDWSNGRLEHLEWLWEGDWGWNPVYGFVESLYNAVKDSSAIFIWTSYEISILKKCVEYAENDIQAHPEFERNNSRPWLVMNAAGEKIPLMDIAPYIREWVDHMLDGNVIWDMCYGTPGGVHDGFADLITTESLKNTSSIKKVLPVCMKEYSRTEELLVSDGLPTNGYEGLKAEETGIAQGLDCTRLYTETLNREPRGWATYGEAGHSRFDQSVAHGLKRYCQLDTLSMVIVYLAVFEATARFEREASHNTLYVQMGDGLLHIADLDATTRTVSSACRSQIMSYDEFSPNDIARKSELSRLPIKTRYSMICPKCRMIDDTLATH